MKNKREYYPFDTRAWKLRREGVMLRKWERSKEVMELAAREKLEAEIGEPVKLILKLMEEDPRRFNITVSTGGNSCYDRYRGYRREEVRESTDKRTGHKIKISLTTVDTGITMNGDVSFRDIYTEKNNPWMTQGEIIAVYNAIDGIRNAIWLQDRKAKSLAQEARRKEGRNRVMEMYKQEMK